MLRRLLATVLVAALLAPVASFSASHCEMAAHETGPQAGLAQPCDCCDDAQSPAAARCSNGVGLRCGCSLQSQSEPRATAASSVESATPRPDFAPALLPAAATIPRLAQRHAIDVCALQAKSSRASLRPLLCSWLI